MELMPDWAEQLAGFLPFQWSFYFPIQTLVGDYSTGELLARARHAGLLDRRPVGSTLFVWRFAVRRYSAVGN